MKWFLNNWTVGISFLHYILTYSMFVRNANLWEPLLIWSTFTNSSYPSILLSFACDLKIISKQSTVRINRHIFVFVFWTTINVMTMIQGFFYWSRPKSPSMELVPPKSEKLLSSPKIAISLLKKWKSKSEPVRLKFVLLSYSKKWRCGRLWLGLSLFSKDLCHL